QTLDAIADLEEGTVFLDLGDLAIDDRPRREPLLAVVPGILTELAQAERNSRGVGVELDDLDPDILADRKDVGDIRHPITRTLGDMDQPIGSAQVDEGAIGGKA